MEKPLRRLAIGLLALAALSFGVSNLLLRGEDPAGWWNFVPAYVFYATVFVLLPAAGLAACVAALRK